MSFDCAESAPPGLAADDLADALHARTVRRNFAAPRCLDAKAVHVFPDARRGSDIFDRERVGGLRLAGQPQRASLAYLDKPDVAVGHMQDDAIAVAAGDLEQLLADLNGGADLLRPVASDDSAFDRCHQGGARQLGVHQCELGLGLRQFRRAKCNCRSLAYGKRLT